MRGEGFTVATRMVDLTAFRLRNIANASHRDLGVHSWSWCVLRRWRRPSGICWLVSIILRRVPPAALFKVRLVCKKWNRLVLSLRWPISEPCWCLFYTEQDEKLAQMFDPVSRSWVSLSKPTPSVAGAFLRSIPSQGNSGLLAFEELDGSHEELALSDGELPPPCFWVGNPLTNTWKFIPGVEELLYESIRHPEYEFVVLSEGPPVHFKIVAFGFRGGHVDPGYVSVVYDSATEEWNPGPRFPFRPWLPVIRGNRIVFVCLRWGLQEVQLLSYNLELEATRVDANVNFGPGLPLFLGDGQWPLLVAVKPWRTGRPSIHEFKQTDGGEWVLEETLQLLPGLKAVNDLVLAHIRPLAPATVSDDDSDNSNSRTITNKYDGPFLSGNGHLLYVNVSIQSLAMYVPSTDRLSLLPLPFQDRDHASRMGSFPIWSFYPRFDLQV